RREQCEVWIDGALLQWGRRVHSAKRKLLDNRGLQSFALQWGRRVHSAKSVISVHLVLEYEIASMGSPSSHGEERSEADCECFHTTRLQWGRRVHSAKSVLWFSYNHTAYDCFNGVAEFTRRSVLTRLSASVHASSFNGVAEFTRRREVGTREGASGPRRFNGVAEFTRRRGRL